MNTNPIIKASELSEYVYCKRAWWLRLNGRLDTTEAMQEGTAAHEELASKLAAYKIKRFLAWGLVGLGTVLLIVLTLLLIFKIV